jgi:glycosyltransferase involved in cell wall biosynthesis
VHLVIDGVVFCAPGHGGIRRVYLEALPRMCRLDEDLAVAFAVHPSAVLMPEHPRISLCRVPNVRNILRPHRIWRAVHGAADSAAWRIRLGSGKGRIWHSTYYRDHHWWQGKRVVLVHDMTYELMPGLFADAEEVARLKRRAIRAADVVLTNSATTADDLTRILPVPRSSIQVIPLGCDRAFWGNDDPPVSGSGGRPRPYLLYVGSRASYKNFGRLLEAYARWRHTGEVDLVVVGAPWRQHELSLLSATGLLGHVTLLHPVGDEQLRLLYKGAVAFVYPSLYEGFGLPLLEAMACRCAIVASNIPSTVEVAQSYPVYFEPADTDSLLAALDRARDTCRTAEREDLARRILGRYTWDNTAREMLRAFRLIG